MPRSAKLVDKSGDSAPVLQSPSARERVGGRQCRIVVTRRELLIDLAQKHKTSGLLGSKDLDRTETQRVRKSGSPLLTTAILTPVFNCTQESS